MRAASHSCDDEYIALNTFAILDIITVKTAVHFFTLNKVRRGAPDI